MTNEDLVLMYQQGDKKALDTIVNQNRGIVRKMVNKYYTEKTSSIDKEDLEQEGLIGLTIAARKYDTEMIEKCKFITYAVYWINQRINSYINKKNTNEEISLNMPVGDDSTQLGDTIKKEDYSFEAVEEKIYLKQLRKELEDVMLGCNTLQQREALKLRYGWDGEPLTCEDIGEILGVSHQRVNTILNTGIRKIRKSPWGQKKIEENLEKEKYTYAYVERKIDYEIDRIRNRKKEEMFKQLTLSRLV